jgi:hypothetical protein
MKEFNQIYQEYFYQILLAGIGIGFLLGLIPLILGYKKERRRYGVAGFSASIACGAFSPILSIITVSIFIWLILRKPKADVSPAGTGNASATGDSPENPADIS